MTSPQARKGGNFEREVFSYLSDQLGACVVRPRVTTADVGDIHVHPLVALECKCYPRDLVRAIRDAESEGRAAARNSLLPLGVGVVKRPGVTSPAGQLAVMNLEQFAYLLREAMA